MLGIGGKFASSKGMARVPNLVNLSRASAKTALSNAGLKFGTESSVNNNVGSSSNGNASSQTIAADTLVDYETTISFDYYGTYVSPVFVTDAQDNCTQSTRLEYVGFVGFDYGPCENGYKQVTSTRAYNQYFTITCTTTTSYSDGTSSTSAPVTFPEIAGGSVNLTRSDGVQAC